MSLVRRFSISIAAVAVFVVTAGAAFYFEPYRTPAAVAYQTPEESDVYVRFGMEAYDGIQKNYWAKAPDADLSALFQLALQKALATTTLPELPSKDRAGTAKMLATAFDSFASTTQKANLARDLVIVALYNLQPAGRSGLLSQKQEKSLRDDVSNIKQDSNLYGDLGVAEGASTDEIKVAYDKKVEELKNDSSPEAQAKLKQAEYAHQVLTDQNDKARYDTSKIEPTGFSRMLGKTFYFNLTKVSPTSLQEFAQELDAATTTPMDSLIIDLRGNSGGALDFARFFFGFFMGDNQYVFDLFHQDEYQVQRTPAGIIPPYLVEVMKRFSDVAVLVDGGTQSTAEVTTATFKRTRLGVVVGTKTKGWGTVENTYPLTAPINPEEGYTMLIVNSLTLREDNQPVEGRGVDPHIDITAPNWRSKLPEYFKSQSIINALRAYADKPPLQ